MNTRRAFLANSFLAALATRSGLAFAESQPAQPLPAWAPGVLEIHHIATGRGNSALLLLPDGTTMMVDAGAIYGTTPYLIAPKPDASHRPGEWIGRYTQRRLHSAGLSGIDVFMATHLHGDHIGYVPSDGPRSADGTYRLTGVSDVAAIVPIHRFVDRAWPDFTYPSPAKEDFQLNYRAFLVSQQKQGTAVERFKVGSSQQFALRHNASAYPQFEIRNLASSGDVWTGTGESVSHRFPDLATLKPADYPSENCCSSAIRLRYGRFAYYTGGDLPSDTNYGRDPWRDIETPVAEVCGHVSVAVANHHGYFNANGAGFIRALQPRVVVIPAWDSAHPTVNVLAALQSRAIYPGDRDIFVTAIKEENRIANKKIDDLKSRSGHVVVRVEPGGQSFRVFVLSNATEDDKPLMTFGPYAV